MTQEHLSGAVTPLPDGSRPISNSELRAFKRCRRKWWLTYYKGLKTLTEPTGPRALGSRLHVILAAYYDPRDDDVKTSDDCLAALRGILELDLAKWPEQAADIRKEFDLAAAMLEGYFEWVAEEGVDADWQVLDIERGVSMPFTGADLPRPATLVAKLDVAIQSRQTGALSFVDHKSVGNLKDLPKNADLDEQFLHYSLIQYLRHLADPTAPFVDGGVFNMLRKVKRTATAHPPFFGRYEVRHTVDELRSYWYRVAGEVEDLMRVEDRLAAGADPRTVAYPNPTRDCAWDCDHRSLCPMLDAFPAGAADYVATAYTTEDPYARYAGDRDDERTT